MRLEELYVDGFGHFHQQSLGPISGAVTVFYGPNEAGKSTLLAFIRAVLFGFPPRFNSHYPPLAGGRHGGRISLTDDAGDSYLVERFAGARGGLSVASAAGAVPNAEALLRRLTGSATPDLFRNVFAFTLDELQVASSLNDSSGTIYSAGQGAPGLPGLTKLLGEQRSRIYLPRGNNQKVPAILNELRAIDEELLAIAGNAGRYGDLTARKTAIDTELRDVDSGLEEIGRKRTKLDRLLDGWEDWVALSSCESHLGCLPKYADFPDSPLPRLDTLQVQVRRSREDWEDFAQQLARAEEAASAEVAHEDLLFDQDKIETIRRGRGSFDGSVKDLPERKAELAALESELADRLRDLGQDWDEERLQAFDTSITFRQDVEQEKEALAATAEALGRARQQLALDQRTLDDYRVAVTDAEERLPPEPLMKRDAVDKRRSALRTARARLGEYERARQNHLNLEGQLVSLTTGRESEGDHPWRSMFLPGLIAAVGVALLVVGLLLGGSALLVGVIGGLGMLGVGGYLYLVRRPRSVENPLATALARQSESAGRLADEARGALLQATQSLALDGEPTADALDGAEARLNAAEGTLSAWTEGRGKVEDAQRRVKSQERRIESTKATVDDAEGVDRRARREWEVWLGEHDLPASFSPDTVLEFMGRVDSARIKQEQVRENRQRVSAIEVDIEEFRMQVEPLAQRHCVTVDSRNPTELASGADTLISRLDVAQSAYRNRELAKEHAEEQRLALETRKKRLETAEAELTALLTAGGTEDEEEFRRRARLHEERSVLERTRDEHRRGLERLSGPGERFDAFCEELKRADPEDLRGQSAALSDRQAEINERRDALWEERGGIDRELTQLTSEEESSALRARRNTLVEQLQENAREWSKYTIAEALLEKTRQKFEQERQPSVVQHAQEFFSRVTGQRYNRLFAPLGKETITVVDVPAAASSRRNSAGGRGNSCTWRCDSG